MLYKIQRTFFAPYIIMTEDIIRSQLIFLQQPGRQLQKGLISGIGKFTAVVTITALYGYGIIVSRFNRIAYFIQGKALNDFPIISDDEMSAG